MILNKGLTVQQAAKGPSEVHRKEGKGLLSRVLSSRKEIRLYEYGHW